MTLEECAPAHTAKPALYLERYARHFEPIRHTVTTLFEMGIYEGGSMLMWRDYFEQAIVAGLDINTRYLADTTGRIRKYQGKQQDLALLNRIGAECAPDGFDVIIDDCSHIGVLTKSSFWPLFDHHLKPGGIYVIEDWGTGYWDTWPDGRRFKRRSDRNLQFWRGKWGCRIFPSHQFGLPGFIKQLVDECALGDITRPEKSATTYRSKHCGISRLDIYQGQVFVVKALC
jgi:SAM-dependent methyltransferase